MPRLLPTRRHEPEVLQPAVFRAERRLPARRPWYFVSLRWKLLLPVFVVLAAVAMLGAYLIGERVAQGVRDGEMERLRRTGAAVAARIEQVRVLQMHQWSDVQAAVGPQLALGALNGGPNGNALHGVVEGRARALDLDLALVFDGEGQEVIGLIRTATESGPDYALAEDTPLGEPDPIQAVLTAPGATLRPGVLRTAQGMMLGTAGPVIVNGETVGAVLVGMQLDRALAMLRGGDDADLALFAGENAALVTATLAVHGLGLPDDLAAWDSTSGGALPVRAVTLNDAAYYAAYLPFTLSGETIGILGLYQRDDTLMATEAGRRMVSAVAAALIGVVSVVVLGVIGVFVRRVERVTRTAHALAAGESAARTWLKPGDEIGELGATLDAMAGQFQQRADALQGALRRQRIETARLTAVLESIPDGLVVQDLDGRVLLMNDAARELVGGQRAFRSAGLHELTAVVTETLGPALAPGIYALGDPTRLPLDGRILQAQAAAILTRQQARLGTVIVLRDITADVEREQARDALLDKLSDQALAPSAPGSYDSLSALAQEVVRNTRSLQRVIAELRDLSAFEPRDLQAGQRALALNELLWHIAAEWQPLARAASMRLEVRFAPRGKFLLGDDRRLRWAIGNVIDNAVKYSPRGTVITLDAHVPDENPTEAMITVTDTGYGIAASDLERVFARFYRGIPRDLDGQPVRKPGTGQGLFIAQRVIEAHGGQITLASREGQGTTATIRLPLTAEVTLEMPDAGQHAASTDTPAGESAPNPFDTVPLEPPRPTRRPE